MYEAYYGLREKPFNLTPDPKYLYLSEKHKEAFAHLLFGIKNRSGFVMVTGEIGTGKTTICRTLLGQLDENTEVAFIFNPYLSPEELLRKINEDFGIATSATSARGLIDELNDYLLDRNARGKNCVLVIDEAQNLTPAVLEQIRLLSNLETETQKLLQIVLIGQPELMQVLSLHELRQLNQRITARYHLQPLSRDETKQYISYRMRVAGARRRIYFTAQALKSIFKISGGTPRVINALCDRSLLIGYTKEMRDISPKIVKHAWKEVRGEQPKRKVWPQIRVWLPSPAITTACIVILFFAALMRDFDISNISGSSPANVTTQQATNASTAPAQPAPAKRDVAFAAPVPVAEKPVEIAPPVEKPLDTTIAGFVDRQDATASRTAAIQGIMRAWSMQLLSNLPASDSIEALTNFATDNEFSCEVMKLTLEQIEAINLPALIKVHGRTRSIWTAVVGAEGNDLRITTASNEVTMVPREKLNECYLNEALVWWRDPNPETVILKGGMSGEDVRMLQVQLRTLGRLNQSPNGNFDQATSDAIKTIQKDVGLRIDGAAGRHTRMVLSSWMPGFNMPGLRSMSPVLERDVAEEEKAEAKKSEAKAEEVASAKESNSVKPEEKRFAPKKNPEPKVARVPGTTGPADEAPKPADNTPPPTIKPEDLPKPNEAAPVPPATPPQSDAPPANNTPAEPAPAAPQVIEQTPPAADAPPSVAPAPAPAAPQPENANAAAPTWPGGLPLVPAEDAGSASP